MMLIIVMMMPRVAAAHALGGAGLRAQARWHLPQPLPPPPPPHDDMVVGTDGLVDGGPVRMREQRILRRRPGLPRMSRVPCWSPTVLRPDREARIEDRVEERRVFAISALPQHLLLVNVHGVAVAKAVGARKVGARERHNVEAAARRRRAP
ncbi:uncharacterized protein VDAG_08661 [Verticillium dahliae VdLs.17]|uniref:Secreted protein n=1 Tax=Verticillium dahliae (strain VdLs.17 / ATCC MYA-4575 / FGSC 10137) TaxID=498257 RepID=G2XES6_VERDV|nr:uncharacterized protein VDAG_08661 [Verticillium dahliae VdLs.17]EGY18327.1 hypothetical protein VDAG_08661 [Verticillium dahliae VdLs.17]